MPRDLPILIACPEQRRVVPGRYACGPTGEPEVAPDGGYLLDRLSCSMNGGRCCQTLCALHRYNRRGPGTWFPHEIIRPSSPRSAPPRRQRPPSDATISGLF